MDTYQPRQWRWIIAALGSLLFGTFGLAAVDGPGVNQFIQAARTTEKIKLDGVLDEAAWKAAPVFTDFVQWFPDNGAKPTERTELRILYDDKHLYIGFICFDSQPELIIERLRRRDKPPASDNVSVGIDSAHDHRTAYIFAVTAAGVLQDGLIYDGTNFTTDWDAVWDARTRRRPDGWSAEMAIPLKLFRFPEADVQTWGFAAAREITRKHEKLVSVSYPRSVNAEVTRWGHLRLTGVKSRPDIELAPYAATRATWRPQFSDDSIPYPRLVDPSADLGLDFKVGLSSQLTLNGAINPDFGQVEADQIILNLTTFEQFFPEKRPLFLQGMDLFQAVGTQDGFSPQQMFYSRRIGLTSPIFAAAKLTGSVGNGVDIALFNATVGGAWQPEVDESRPNRKLGFSWRQPLHLAPTDALPNLEPVSQNFFAAVVRKRLFSNSTVGVSFTSAIPLTGTCTAALTAAFPDDRQPAPCRARGGNAVALDWNLRSSTADWGILGQIDASEVVKGLPSRILPDGTVLHPGSTGFGSYVRGGKVAGEPFRFEVLYEYESPWLDLNFMGFQPRQNRHRAMLGTKLFKSQIGSLQNASLALWLAKNWSADGRGTNIGRGIWLTGSAFFPGYHFLGCEVGVDDAELDIRDVGTGVPLQRRAIHYLSCSAETDSSRILSIAGQYALGLRLSQASLPATVGFGGNVRLTVRSHSRVETQLTVANDLTPYDARYASGAADGPLILAHLQAEFLSFTVRQLFVLTPRLTLQGYAQLFTAYGKYGPFFTPATPVYSRARFSDLVLAAPTTDPSFHSGAMNVSLVLRWEYRLGSALFFVYSRSQSELPYPSDVSPPGSLSYRRLFQGPATDVFLIKWSYWWDG